MNTVITDMSGAVIEHSTVITNFVAIVYSQLKNKGYENCKIYQYMYFYYILFL